MSKSTKRVRFTPGLMPGIRVEDRITDLQGDGQKPPDAPGPTIPDDVSQQPSPAFPPYIQTAVESDVGHALGMRVCEVLIREFVSSLASTFSIAPHYFGDLLMDLASELDGPPPRANS